MPKELSDDRSRLERLSGGDTTALTEIYEDYRRVVFARAFVELSSRSDAEEVMQDTFLLLWKKRRRIRLVGNSVLPWLLTSARYLSANRRRYLGRRAAEPLEHSDSMDSTFDPGAIIARDEFQRFIDTAVLKLQPLDREILRLCIVEGLTYKEAAARLRTTHAVVRNRLSRARAALRADVSAYIRTEER